MFKKKDEYPSTITINNFSSTATLTNNEPVKVPVSDVTEKRYDPYENRSVEHPNSPLGAIIHLVKASLGIGIVAVPRAFKTAGLVLGFVGTILIGIMCTHSVHILVKASLIICERRKCPSMSFSETAEAIFSDGPKRLRSWSGFAKNSVEIGLCLTHFLGNAVYVVFVSESLAKLISAYYPEAESWGLYIKFLILLPLILCCQVRELKYLVPFSFVANITMTVAFAITIYYMFHEIKDADLSERHLSNGITSIPSFFSNIIFSMEGIGAILPLENSMVKPKFIGCPGVLNVGMTIVTTVFVGMGFLGYCSFGEATEAAITQNLPSGEIPSQIVQACISASVFLSFMLIFYVPFDITWTKIKDKIPESKHNIAQIVLRTIAVIMIVAVAAAAGHHLDIGIDLIGAICLASLGIMFPAVLDLVVHWDNWGVFNWILIKDVALIIVSIFGTVSGTYSALKSVI